MRNDDYMTKYTPAERTLMVGSVAMITMFAFESLATTTVMPSVVDDIGSALWIPIASGAPLAAQVLTCVIAGPLVDARGARRFLTLGVSAFAVGLLLCAFAPSMLVFVAGRTIQGLGAGFSVVPLYVLVGAIASDEHRRAFFAAFSMAWVLPSLVGAPIAGFTTQAFGWRPVFWSVAVLIVICFLVMLPLLRLSPEPQGELSTKFRPLLVRALAVGLGLLLAQGASTLPDKWSLLAIGVGIAITLGFLPALLPKGTFSARPPLGSLIATRGLTIAANVGASSLIPMVVETVRGWDPAQASLVVAAGSISWACGSMFQARVDKNRQRLPRVGAIFLCLGLIPVLSFPLAGWPVWIGISGWVLAGLGIGLTHATISDLALASSPSSEHGKVSASLQVADNAGPALSLALVSVVMTVAGIANVSPWLPALMVGLAASVLGVAASRRIRP